VRGTFGIFFYFVRGKCHRAELSETKYWREYFVSKGEILWDNGQNYMKNDFSPLW
jgi:hypothetical protein